METPNIQTKKQAKKALENAKNKGSGVIYRLNSVFPFDLFPDSIVIDHNKVSIVRRTGPFSQKIFPIALADIKTVTVYSGILFASLTLEIAGYEQNPGTVIKLNKFKAQKARKIIMGLIVANRQEIDLSKLSTKQLSRDLPKIGKTNDKPQGLAKYV